MPGVPVAAPPGLLKGEGQLLEDVDQPARGLQDCDALSERVVAERLVEQLERAPVGRVLRRRRAEFCEALD